MTRSTEQRKAQAEPPGGDARVTLSSSPPRSPAVRGRTPIRRYASAGAR